MKTMLLFSSFFYLLGVKLGNTVEVIKKIVLPVRTAISAPVTAHKGEGRNYYVKPSELMAAKKDSLSASGVTKQQGSD